MGGGAIFLEPVHSEKARLVEKPLQRSLLCHPTSKFLEFQSPHTSVCDGKNSSHTPVSLFL